MLRSAALAMLFGACSLLAFGCDVDRGRRAAGDAPEHPPAFGPPGRTVEVAGLESLPHRPLLRLDGQEPELLELVLYDDGLVLVPDPAAGDRQLLSANIGPRAAAAMAQRIVRGGFFDLPERGPNDCGISDLHGERILVRDGARWHEATYFGIRPDGIAQCSLVKAGGAAAFGAPHPEPPPPDKYSPLAFTRAYVRLANFKLTNPAPWIAEGVRIHVQPWEAAWSAVPWPDGVPMPGANLKPSGFGGYYVVPAEYAARIHAFEKVRTPREAVEANGVKWAFHAWDVYPAEDYLEEVVHAPNELTR